MVDNSHGDFHFSSVAAICSELSRRKFLGIVSKSVCLLPGLSALAESDQSALWFVTDDRYLATSGEVGWAKSIQLLTYQPTDSCEYEEGCVVSPSGWIRKISYSMALVNTSNAIWRGPTAAEHPDWFSTQNCHHHVHMLRVSECVLIDALTGAVLREGRKEGWCIRCLVRFTGSADPVAGACDAPVLAPGWGDIYGPNTPCNGVDVTGLPDGYYILRLTLDPLYRYGFHSVNSQLVYLSASGVAKITPPTLSINRSESGVTVSWTANADWKLQTSTDLVTWTTRADLPGPSQSFPIQGPQKHFRLILQP